ncbi:amidase [Oharaeibacter diazotrophicus]|uniref:amidase n=1 Tax=Oharaeibacter diazotrophicus TaxID=1920512 RepID=UPI000F81A696|nr:amidase [Oharaeibacter diazotrophicus]
MDIKDRSALQLAAMIQSGLVDAEYVAEATLAAIAAADPAIFTRVTAGRAMVEAREASRRIRAGRARGPLDGVPVAWKDLFAVEGLATTAGSRILADDPPATADAAVVARLQAAGMVAVGRVNMTEFAFSGLGLNPHYGTPANPHSTDEPRIPGGSSSGSAVAVAAGLVPVAIGTDTGGSVRIPAHFNGVVGYKATRGRYPMAGVHPLSTSLDSLGCFTRTVEDAVLVDAAMNGLVASPIRRGAVAGARLVVPETVMFDGAEPEVVAAVEAAVKRLEAAGAVVTRRPLPVLAEVLSLYAEHGALVTAEAYAVLRRHLDGPGAAGMDRRVVARSRLGANIATTDYIALLAARAGMVETLARELDGAFLIHPTVPHVAPPIAALEADDDLFVAVNGRTLRNTLIGNYLDTAGVSLPCGTGAAGLPVGLLVSAPGGADEALLSFCLAAEPVVRLPNA